MELNREKQIEEMAHLVCEMALKPNSCRECDGRKGGCFTIPKMKILYNAGYRKASEVVRDVFNDLNEMWHKGRGFIHYSDLVKLERLHEQKYTEEGK